MLSSNKNFITSEKVFTPIITETVEIPVLKKTSMKFFEAIRVIDGHKIDGEFFATKHALEERLTETTESEEQATCYFYLLRLLLSEHVFFENQRVRTLYDRMFVAFLATEKQYKKEWRMTRGKNERKLLRAQLEAFYQLIDGRFASIEAIYDHKGFATAKARAYEDKMRFRCRAAHFLGKHFTHLGHLFLEHTTRYGNSFVRWSVTVFLFIALFAGIYALIDLVSPVNMFTKLGGGFHPFDYFYFSLVTFTTVGYGDITPFTVFEKLFAGMESLLGYVMLGILLTLIQRRF